MELFRDDPTMLTFPLKDGSEWRLTESIVAELAQLYPELDVLEECRHALAWVLAHPERRKARMRAFLSGWLTRTSRERKFSVGGGQVRPKAAKADMYGHIPPCESVTACTAKALAEAREMRR